VKLKVTKQGPSRQLMELGPATGMWSDAALEAFLGQTDRGWPAKLAKVDGVYFHWRESVTHFAGFAALPNLTRVWGVKGALKSLDGLEHCAQLKFVSFPSSDDMRVTTLAPLAGLAKLRLPAFKKLTNIDALPSLRVLDFANGEKVKSLAPLGMAKNLEVLSLRGWNVAKLKLDDLAGLTKLRLLDLSCYGLGDVSALAKLPKLAKVRVYGYGDLKKLKGANALKAKLVNGDNGVKDFDDDVLVCDE
jgi:hypothetical protein